MSQSPTAVPRTDERDLIERQVGSYSPPWLNLSAVLVRPMVQSWPEHTSDGRAMKRQMRILARGLEPRP